ncbi:MAG: hypothetical protein KF796_02260 [Ramlibacter sp.]|nr:hypothetical protein [Ramlibacter sp.]
MTIIFGEKAERQAKTKNPASLKNEAGWAGFRSLAEFIERPQAEANRR